MANKAISPSVRTAVRTRGDYWALAYKIGPVHNSLVGMSALARAELIAFGSAKLAILGKAAGVPIGVRMTSYYKIGG